MLRHRRLAPVAQPVRETLVLVVMRAVLPLRTRHEELVTDPERRLGVECDVLGTGKLGAALPELLGALAVSVLGRGAPLTCYQFLRVMIISYQGDGKHGENIGISYNQHSAHLQGVRDDRIIPTGTDAPNKPRQATAAEARDGLERTSRFVTWAAEVVARARR